MEHHESARRNSLQWNADENNIVGYLHGPCKLKKRFPVDMIQRICGIIMVNAFEARTKYGHEIRCVFPKTAVMSHSCVPNTCHSILASDGYKYAGFYYLLSMNFIDCIQFADSQLVLQWTSKKMAYLLHVIRTPCLEHYLGKSI